MMEILQKYALLGDVTHGDFRLAVCMDSPETWFLGTSGLLKYL